MSKRVVMESPLPGTKTKAFSTRLSIRVSIPTIPRRINFLADLIGSLNSQTYHEFDIALIVTRGSAHLYRDIESSVPIKVIEQPGQGFMDAMETTVRSSMDYDVNVNLDDDSTIGRDHVEKYRKAFSKSQNIGLIFGTDNGNIPGVQGNFDYFLKFNHLINRKPLIENFAKYHVYFNSAGLLAGKTNYGTGEATILGSGTNMAWISEALEDAHLPSYNVKSLGILNEQYLALQSAIKGYGIKAERIDSTPRKETRGKSLSSDNSTRGYGRRLLELYSSPIFVHNIISVDTRDLKKAILKMKLMPLRGEVRRATKVLGRVLESIESGLKEEEAVNDIEKVWERGLVEVRA